MVTVHDILAKPVSLIFRQGPSAGEGDEVLGRSELQQPAAHHLLVGVLVHLEPAKPAPELLHLDRTFPGP